MEKSKEELYKLAVCYYLGKGVKSDNKKAYELCLKSACSPYPPAIFLMGLFLMYGIGVNPDPRRASLWYQDAAELGDLRALYKLGECYEKGVGIYQYIPKARELYEHAAERGYERAKRKLRAL